MAVENWRQIKEIFNAALQQESEERRKFLDQVCDGDDELRREVESLLSSYGDAESFMESPAAEEVADVIESRGGKLQKGISFTHYEIIEQVGTGGMGEVYLAADKKLDRRVAIKVLNEKFARHESNLQRFVREAKAASALNHPNILTVHEIGKAEGINFIVGEFVEGKTLREILAEKSLPLAEILDISIQIANALVAAHEAHLVHRDIKPENIMIRPDGFVKVLDFGLAKLVEQKGVGFEESTVRQNQTAKGVILGTVQYMSPEQAKGKKVDERTDIFSLGIVIYEMLAGRTPFAGESVSETFANLINSEPQPLGRFVANVPDELQRIIAKTLRKNANERYQTMKGLLTDLKNLQRQLEFESEFKLKNLSGVNAETLELKLEKKESQPGNSIAVLPFVNMSADAENEYFCDGLAEELINALANIKNLKVAARTSAFAFKNKNAEVGEIGKTLNVNTILEGSVRRSGSRLRISVQLVNSSDGFHLWSKRYDGEMKDVFDLQDEITLAVIDELKVKFLSEEKIALQNRYDQNVEAYQLYLKGRFHYLKLRPDEIQKGISYFEQAIALDADYALAYVGLAQAFQTLPLAAELPANEFFPKAKAAARRAIEINENLAEAHGILGSLLFWFDWDWNASESECRRAIELDPESADAREAYAHLLSNIGRHDEALAEIKIARELDPLNLRINAFEGQFLLHAGNVDEALIQLQKTIELEPGFWLSRHFAASVYIEKGMFSEAAAEAEKAKMLSGGGSHAAAHLVYALAKSGKQTEAEAAFEQVRQSANVRHVPAYHLALACLGLNRLDETFSYLESAFQNRDPKLTFLKVEPKWNSLRFDSRFRDLLRRVGFPADEFVEDKEASKANAADPNKLSSDISSKTLAANNSTSEITTRPSPGVTINRKYIFIVGFVILLIASIGSGYYFYFSKTSPSDPANKKTLAVLPFVNSGNDPNAEYLADGIAESLVNNLSQLSELKVMSRNSAFRFKNDQSDVKTIAARLNVETLITGDIKQLGDKYVINVRLIDGKDDSQIWGSQYVKTNADIIAAQNEIAQAVVVNLRLKLTDSERQQLAKRYTDNSEAYQLYLRGRYHALKRTKPETQKAISYFQQAIDIDPAYALAYAGLAEAYRSALASDMPPADFLPRSKAAAQKAVELDDTLADGHAELGFTVFWYDWDWQSAEKHFNRALELDPNKPEAHIYYAHLLSNTGRHSEALAAAKRAREIDPLNLLINSLEGQFLLHAGQSDEALNRLHKTFELDQNYFLARLFISSVYIEKELFAEAVNEARKAREIAGIKNTYPTAFLCYALAKSGREREARAELIDLLKSRGKDYVSPYSIALIYNALGGREKTLAFLEQAYQQRDQRIVFLKVEPKWNNLRSDPRFVDLMRRMKFE